jgi:hypothetical protein
MAGVAPGQRYYLQNLHGISTLAHHSVGACLLDLQPEIVVPLTKVSHLELLLHLLLELLEL